MLRTRRVAVAAMLCVLGLLGGCAAQTPVSDPTPSPRTATPTPTPTPVDPAVAAVAEMSTGEQAASVVMGHIPTTDPTALAEYMAAGYGGFILMGANIPATQDELRGVTRALATDAAPRP